MHVRKIPWILMFNPLQKQNWVVLFDPRDFAASNTAEPQTRGLLFPTNMQIEWYIILIPNSRIQVFLWEGAGQGFELIIPLDAILRVRSVTD